MNERTTTFNFVLQNRYFVGWALLGFRIFAFAHLVSLYEIPHMLVKTMSCREAAKRDIASQNDLCLGNYSI
jgi:hypothetical protein